MVPFEFGDDPFDILSTTTVSCTVTKGDLPIEINWMFNENRLKSNDGILIYKSGQRISMLSIESVQPRHAGNYTCIARNEAGETRHTSELIVIGTSKTKKFLIIYGLSISLNILFGVYSILILFFTSCFNDDSF